MKASLQLIPEQPAEQLLAAAQAADELGYYACYSADEIYHKDAWLLLTAAAGRTERIRLGPCVAPVYMRDPTYVAQLAATLDELSRGRAEVVLGIGNLAMLEQYAIEWRGSRPIARLREAYRVIRELLDEGSIDFQGEFFRYAGVTTAARSVQERVPLKLGAMGGPKSMQLAGEIADGLHTACAYSPEALRYAVHHFQVGATSRPCHRPCSRGMALIPRTWRRSTKPSPEAMSSAPWRSHPTMSPIASWSRERPKTGSNGSARPTRPPD